MKARRATEDLDMQNQEDDFVQDLSEDDYNNNHKRSYLEARGNAPLTVIHEDNFSRETTTKFHG